MRGPAGLTDALHWRLIFCALAIVLLLAPQGVGAQEKGKVTSLPIPRYVSLKANEANVRRGPSLTHRVDWVFRHKEMPLQVTAEYGHWRRVQDVEGQGGWVHYSLLSGVRTAVVTQDDLILKRNPDRDAQPKAVAKLGTIGRLKACLADWCEISASGHTGWVEKKHIWGIAADEIRD